MLDQNDGVSLSESPGEKVIIVVIAALFILK